AWLRSRAELFPGGGFLASSSLDPPPPTPPPSPPLPRGGSGTEYFLSRIIRSQGTDAGGGLTRGGRGARQPPSNAAGDPQTLTPSSTPKPGSQNLPPSPTSRALNRASRSGALSWERDLVAGVRVA
ncbi:hypothetical protein H1C71_027396, partial [Ictidomys tridecemlineatus]